MVLLTTGMHLKRNTAKNRGVFTLLLLMIQENYYGAGMRF
jgi:hypothetical protein